MPKYPFTDVILQTRSCGSPCKYYLDILQYKNQPSSKMRLCLITHFHFPLSQQGHKLVPKYCRKFVKIFSSCSARTLLHWKPKAGTLLLLGDTSNGTLQQPPLLQLQSSVFYSAASCLRLSCRSLGRKQAHDCTVPQTFRDLHA